MDGIGDRACQRSTNLVRRPLITDHPDRPPRPRPPRPTDSLKVDGLPVARPRRKRAHQVLPRKHHALDRSLRGQPRRRALQGRVVVWRIVLQLLVRRRGRERGGRARVLALVPLEGACGGRAHQRGARRGGAADGSWRKCAVQVRQKHVGWVIHITARSSYTHTQEA